jgi:predicted DNA-binding protein YlxM (UPF0122 family)
LDKITKLNLLFDYYGDFLTKKQKDIFELYHINDLSLGEIADNKGISRQGVYDILQRTEHILYNFEEKLGMVAKHFTQKKEIEEILTILKNLKPGISYEYQEVYKQVFNRVVSLLKEGGG